MSAAFWKKVDRRGADDCWHWTGARTGGRDGDTYGTFARSRKLPGRRMIYAHRMAYCLAAGVDPCTLDRTVVVRHRCDNPVCCNPAHLEPGSAADNVQDKVERGRVLRGSSIKQAILHENDVRRVKERLAAGDMHHTIAAEYGVSRATISQIARGATWAWLIV